MNFLLRNEYGRKPNLKIEKGSYYCPDEESDMTPKYLRERLLNDLSKLDIPVDEFTFELRAYSRTLYGNYIPKGYRNREKACIRIYPFKQVGEVYPYADLLITAIHESCHHLQYRNPDYIRRRGIMHDAEFYKFLQEYVKKAVDLDIIREKNQ